MARKKIVELSSKADKLTKSQLAAQKKLLDTQRQILAEKKKQEALEKASLLLSQGKKLFDEEAIQLAAAAQGKLTEEERVRVGLKQNIYDLEEAINQGNLDAAARISQSLVNNAQQLSNLRQKAGMFDSISNPFNAWLETLKELALEFAKLAKIEIPKFNPFALAQPLYKYNSLSQQLVPGTTERSPMGYGGGQFDMNLIPSTPLYQYNSLSQQATPSGDTIVNISVSGSVTTERDLVAAITQGLYAQQASGTPVTYSTVY
jgi:actin-related protein